ncbi:subclass B1 metallo-beta-lactamase [Echinicola marina]|uniref:subclass B1 metallo-beta-lactamase n=1 Tax=Echinicola marina TaxID=2859768 RepID=UPI001CF658A2|nr:subclass B1 metallo-beta-lactamase [Echinicola marina]UCS94884.1 subclass B1 metallo-beta-lactamase [Echinicola marina]
MKVNLLLFILLVTLACNSEKPEFIYESESLSIKQLSPNSFLHVSYLETTDFGKVPCNGLIVIDHGEALIVDTPVTEGDSKELIDWIKTSLKCQPIGVVATHFHTDCIGGLGEFHRQDIPSYANRRTIDLAKENHKIFPQHGFEGILQLKIGKTELINEFLGEGHTKDNIISYFPQENVLFGGCLIKELRAGKGNLEDANTVEWPTTVSTIKQQYEKAEIIIPGHGTPGGKELLDYTIALFKDEDAR